MKRSLSFVLVSLLLFLTACGSQASTSEGTLFEHDIAEFIDQNYTFQDVVSSQENSSDISEIYIAEDKSIDEVVNELQEHEEPEKLSERSDNKQALIYDNLFVIVTEDEDNPENSTVEIAEQQFVRDNYNPSFFNGLFALWLLDEVLDVDDWGKKRQSKCKNSGDCYGGYQSSGGLYKKSSDSKSIRSSSVRGGGPGAGK
ncbi:DUF4247 domain-containing protein [Virgibacillus pantothenticus]|uniref:DUF4247 domain-containing protein n=1 Tax=Virgibacillus pantothenticus TaxID=1473 RepID=A0A0L0QV10_VIRPA|nr:DUF4247 domain-containing protein [Virgibacillus pantothenticus]KNE22411.1 hypothetical protein AFK71_01975 [Virgibacillus pantothenticus]MED3736982.1 DUF4247 domain-containing protein [Virgibacillus pantothenticus]QTY16866.1 DUF4247 domain-containing protein [Virgibacillus pantothenticus]SIS86067.1 protein of unknown function [Virgibacillus pantothenticus]